MKESLNKNFKELFHPIEVDISDGQILESTLRDISQFQPHIKRVNFFSDDEADEFFVIRESGKRQGIFKTWAVPTIPFLESNSLSLFNEVLSKTSDLQKDIESTKALKDVLEKWTKINSDQPARFFESLERWRAFSQIYDRRLTNHFQEKPLPEDPDTRIAELFLRLFISFEVSSSFYNLEAIAGDMNNSKYNPSSKDKENGSSGGSLDVVGMLLPSALPALVSAKRLDWNGLTWEHLRQNLTESDPEELKIVFRIAKELDVAPEDVVFAANVLEWIPVNVGGKKGDVDPDTARKMISKSLNSNKISSTDSVSRNINALIRFLNWFPLVKNSKNFEGLGWRYAAVCDTASQLVEEVENRNFFEGNFGEIFSKEISPQIKNVDATSAKGRLMIQLFLEKKFNQKIYDLISQRSKGFMEEITQLLAKDKRREYVANLHDHQPRALVGGKTAGLREAGIIFGKENVVPGVVITSEAINDWLKGNKNIWSRIIELNQTADINKRLKIAKTIEKEIKKSDFPLRINYDFFDANSRFTIARSSSFDEDSDITGSAAGIYESVPCLTKDRLPLSVSQVVSSFFSEKAVSFRSLNGLSDLPMFAVLINPLIEGPGGIAFSLGNDQGWEVVTAKTPNAVANNHSEGFDSFKLSKGLLTRVNNNAWLDEKTVMEVGKMVKNAEGFLGLKVDVEFVVDTNNKIWILQLRTLHEKKISKVEDKNGITSGVTLNKLSELDTIKVDDNSVGLKLNIGPEIDLNQFQGTLFRWLVANRNAIKEITLSKRIPRTGHFANICLQLGIKLNFPNAK